MDISKTVFRILIIMVLAIFIINTTNSYAGLLSDVISGGDEFLNSGDNDISIDKKELQTTSSQVYNALVIISFVVAAIVGIILGVKYMMAGVDQKADVKQNLLIYVIGCVVAFGAFGIWRIIVTTLNNV